MPARGRESARFRTNISSCASLTCPSGGSLVDKTGANGWGKVEKAGEQQGSDGRQPERPGLIGGLAQRLQDGVRATIEALGQSHAQQLAAIIETSDDAIISEDLSGIIATWNRGAEKLYGYEAAAVIGRPITILLPPELQNEEA